MTGTDRPLFLLRHPPSADAVRDWYDNIPREVESERLAPRARAYLGAYYTEAGLLTGWRRPFFYQHYARLFSQALRFLPSSEDRPTILDLGCGTGTQSLALAMLGARVVSIDLDRGALDVFRQRKATYEQQLGRQLDIAIHEVNCFAFPFESVAPIHGVYSLFAFNMMQPTAQLLDAVLPHVARDGRIALQDGNSTSWLGRLRPRPVLAPRELDAALTARGCVREALTGGAALPPIAWRLLPASLLRGVEDRLLTSWTLAISYVALYRKL